MNPSLRRRLLTLLSAAVLLAWTATAFFSYLDARRAIGAMLDDHLRQSAALLAVDPGGTPAGSAPAGHADGWVLLFQVRDAAGRVLRRSAGAPDGPLAPVDEGFADIERASVRWRAFALTDPAHGLSVQVAERHDLRDALAGSVVSHLMHPLAVALPVLAGLVWLSVGWGLAPLRAFAREVAGRDPDALHALASDGAPDELRSVARALDGLFARIGALLEKERRFTADAAHELRTPLAAIKTHAQVALAEPEEAGRRAAIARVVEGADRAARLVEQLLLLARLDPQSALPVTPVRLDEAARGCVAGLAPWAAGKGVDLGLVGDTGAAEATVMGDAALLGVLARNLMDNAVRYTPPGGRVDVAVVVAEGRVLLRVADDGPGIPEAERGRAFDRFHRVPGSGETGSGLGLSIAARIAALHGAALTLGEGIGGQGLSVTVAFPKEAPQPADARPRRSVPESGTV
ncbi:ATP-binding protein [Azospirillum sp. TSO22-1]|uniref:ATP-binding protein n=1 Tax=Azospirillum sp. TSO22-1 TaxID=716789 RepID=UPI000D621CD2|nr:ATP-binding protein [Azospirillum sp. TSO22-1]PWC32001.1 hypothetical protein TSO221_31935 [Azospirillum sp. TSO22-1]